MKRKKRNMRETPEINKRVKISAEKSSKGNLTDIQMSFHTKQTYTDLTTTGQDIKQKKSTCMKHKKRDKYILDDNIKKVKKVKRLNSQNVKLVKRLDPHKTIVPQTLGAVSMNWREMLQVRPAVIGEGHLKSSWSFRLISINFIIKVRIYPKICNKITVTFLCKCLKHQIT